MSETLSNPGLAAQDSTTSRPRAALICVLLAMTVAVGLKLITADRPIARDVMLYTVIGHEMFEGRELYSDLFEHKPPLFLAIFGVADAVAGYGKPAILLLNITFTLATLLGVYYSARQLGASAWAGAFAAGCWALISNDVNMHAHQPMPECFINACMIWAFGLFLKLDSRSLHIGRCLLIGTMLMFASQVKQPVVIIAAGWAFVHLITKVSQPGERKRRLIQLALIASVGIITWAAMFGYFFAVGRGQIFYDSLFTYNKHYAGLDADGGGFIQGLKVTWWNLNNGLLPHRLFPMFMITLVPLVIASFVATPFGLFKGESRERRAWLLWLVFFVTTFLLVTTPGRGYNHYYLVYLPVFIAGGAGAFALIDRMCSQARAKVVKISLATIALVTLAVGTAHQLTSADTIWERPGYAAYYRTVERLAAEFDRVLLPEETLYVWDYQPAFYVLPKRKPPAGIFYNTHAMKGPLVEELSGRVLRMLDEHPPEILIIAEETLPRMRLPQVPLHPVYEWIRKHATELPMKGASPFAIYVRNDGPLAKRLASGEAKLE